jgi:hypothetical protein
MKLPHGDSAQIPPGKLLGYLLSETHSVGRAKAKFFRSLGFNEANVNLLHRGLIRLAQSEDVKESMTTLHGTKYVIEGLLVAPSGRSVHILTVWIVDRGVEQPRFVTAYPA